jgi:adenylate cyclase, class 2
MIHIEVESKLRVDDISLTREKIRKLARFIGIENKVDDYYALDSKERPKKSVRVRRKGRKVEINIKKWIDYKNGIYAKKEIEFEVSDTNAFFELMKDFGFKKWLRKEKRTELYKNGNASIELNHVKNIGWFIEIEILCSKKDVEKAREKISSLRKELGLDRKVEKRGYTEMLLEKRRS